MSDRKKRLYACLLFFVFCCSKLEAQTDAKKVRLLWQKDYGTLIKEISDPARAVDLIKQGKVPNRVLKTREGILVIDNKGEIKKQIKRPYKGDLYMSEGGSYILKTVPDKKLWQEGKMKYVLLDNDGNVLYENGGIIPKAIFVSEMGNLAVVKGSHGMYSNAIYFYNSMGNQVGKYTSEDGFRLGYGAWSLRGDRFAYTYRKKKKAYILVFGDSGNLLWSRELNGIFPGRIKFADTSPYFVYKFSDFSYVHYTVSSNNGEAIRTFQFPIVVKQGIPPYAIKGELFAFGPTSKFLIFHMEKRDIVVEATLGPTYEIHSVSLSNSGAFIAVCGINDRANGETSDMFVALFNKEGQKIWEKIVPVQPSLVRYRSGGKVQISPNGEHIWFFNAGKVWVFKWLN